MEGHRRASAHDAWSTMTLITWAEAVFFRLAARWRQSAPSAPTARSRAKMVGKAVTAATAQQWLAAIFITPTHAPRSAPPSHTPRGPFALLTSTHSSRTFGQITTATRQVSTRHISGSMDISAKPQPRVDGSCGLLRGQARPPNMLVHGLAYSVRRARGSGGRHGRLALCRHRITSIEFGS